jgi:hypothetical protein
VLAKQVLSQLSYTCRLARGQTLGTSLASVDPKATAALECYADLADDTLTAVVEEYVDDDTTKLYIRA